MCEIITVPAENTDLLMKSITEVKQQMDILSMTNMVNLMDAVFGNKGIDTAESITVTCPHCKETKGMKSELTGNVFCTNGHLIREGKNDQ